MHKPVLYQEIIHALQPQNAGRYVDGTVGAGGHALGILQASAPNGKLLGFDVDSNALAIARQTLANYADRIHLVQASHITLSEQLAKLQWNSIDGIVLDLGASSMQFDNAERGFSFMQDGPLDMRFGINAVMSADEIINSFDEKELADIIFKYGEDRDARKIAKAIVMNRPLHTTGQLVAVIEKASPRKGDKTHPATQTFQALRIAVNDELVAVEKTLPQAVTSLRRGGRCAVISFHSLEDRIVKEYFRDQSKEIKNPPYEKIYEQEREAIIKIINKKPIVATEEEIKENPRARSAKLRVIEKL
jgi:16S rRNA (cytosine1402-N4)-methyltransferase